MKQLGATLRSIIENHHLQKNTVAEKVGITPTYLSNIFNKNTIDCELLDKLSKAVGVPAAYFFDDELPVGRCNTIENIKAEAIVGASIQVNQNQMSALKALLEEKERTIQILMAAKGFTGTNSGQSL